MTRVLVVDDSPTTRQLLLMLVERAPNLKLAGQAASGVEAVRKARELQPDVITMDVVMPDMDGVEATRRIMAEKPVPIVVVSAYADAPQMDVAFEALAAGAVDILPKCDSSSPESISDWGQELVAKLETAAAAQPRAMTGTQ